MTPDPNANMIDVGPWWPSPSPEKIAAWQRRVGLEDDGVLGKLSRAKLWPDEGATRVELDYPSAPDVERSRLLSVVDDVAPTIPISDPNLYTLCTLLSSEWTTGFAYLSGEDGVTMGFRRYAGGGLRDALTRYVDELSAQGSYARLRAIVATIDGRNPDNGWPVGDWQARIRLLRIARDPAWWRVQLAEFVDDLKSLLASYPGWRRGRTIALAMRARNSDPDFVDGLSQDDDRAYRQLADRYVNGGAPGVTGRGERAESRIRRVESAVGSDELWR